MIDLAGSILPLIPHSPHKHMRDLEEFDGPLLSHFRSEAGQDFLYYWCDCDESHNRWMILRVKREDIERLAAREIPLSDVIPRAALDQAICFVDTDANGQTARVCQVALEQVPGDYVPETGAYLDPPDPSEEARPALLRLPNG